MIHVGYGLEFGLIGMLAEGLALTAVHQGDARSSALIPPSIFSSADGLSLDDTASRLSTLTLNSSVNGTAKESTSKHGKETHAFDILSRMLKDDRFPQKPRNFIGQFQDTLAAHADALHKYAEQWTIDISKPGEIDRKMEELLWTSSVMYGIGGWNDKSGFTADFFLMHLVTSSLFLPSVLPYISARSQVLLLRAYFVTILTWWVARGRPGFSIKKFFDSTSTLHTSPVKPLPYTPDPSIPVVHAQTPNAWLPVLQSTLVHPNDHLAKIQRALAHYAAIYGEREVGYFEGTELEGAERIDGTLFVRAAGMTMDKMGWTREGEEGQMWSFDGFYLQE